MFSLTSRVYGCLVRWQELTDLFVSSPEHEGLEDLWGGGDRVGTRKVHAIKVLCEAVKAKGELPVSEALLVESTRAAISLSIQVKI